MDDTSNLTQFGAIIGTPAYMAPEQASGQPVDSRCDLFSLGCVLYCICAGEKPFKGNDTMSVLKALAMNDPQPPESLNLEVPTELSDLVMQLLAKKPEDRPESAKMVAETLQDIEEKTSEMTAAPGRKTQKVKKGGTRQIEAARTQVSKPAKRRLPLPWLGAGGVLGLGVVGLLLFFLLWPSDKQADGKRKPEGDTPVATKAETPSKNFTNSIGMKFVWIPPGNFMMGSPEGEVGRRNEETQHKVTLTKGFYMGVYEVTQEQWQEVMGNNPSTFKGEKNLPVEMTSWVDCQEFIKRLREKDKKPYRLPTEAEWEYTCRAETKTAYYFGDSNSNLGQYAWFSHNSEKKTHPVGQKKPNQWGLHDMHGNVWELCQDWFGDYPQKDVVDPTGPEKGPFRVLRGGSWVSDPDSCRSACRAWNVPGHRSSRLGFRVCYCLD